MSRIAENVREKGTFVWKMEKLEYWGNYGDFQANACTYPREMKILTKANRGKGNKRLIRALIERRESNHVIRNSSRSPGERPASSWLYSRWEVPSVKSHLAYLLLRCPPEGVAKVADVTLWRCWSHRDPEVWVYNLSEDLKWKKKKRIHTSHAREKKIFIVVCSVLLRGGDCCFGSPRPDDMLWKIVVAGRLGEIKNDPSPSVFSGLVSAHKGPWRRHLALKLPFDSTNIWILSPS
jgi:hypothetical protein